MTAESLRNIEKNKYYVLFQTCDLCNLWWSPCFDYNAPITRSNILILTEILLTLQFRKNFIQNFLTLCDVDYSKQNQ